MPTRTLLLLLAALAAGFALRAYGLARASPCADEYGHIFNAVRYDAPRGAVRLAGQNATHLLLDPLQTYLLARVSDRLWWLRLASLAWGLAAIVGVWRLGVLAGAPGTGAAAAALLAVSPLHVEWSRRVDFYALLAGVAVWHAAAFLKMSEQPRSYGRYAAWSAVFLHAHPYAFLAGAIHAVFLAVERRREALASLARAWALAFGCFIPWLAYSARSLANRRIFELGPLREALPLPRFLAGVPLDLSLATEFHDPFGPSGGIVPVLVCAGLAALFILSFASARRRRGPRAVRLAHATVLAGLALVVAVDLFFHWFFAPRQLVWLVPFYLFAAADGGRLWLETLAPRLRTTARVLASGLVLAAAVPACVEADWSEQAQMRSWRELAQRVDSAVEPGDVFVCDNSVVALEFFYHFDPRGAFRSFTGFRRGAGGIEYDVPDGVRAGRLRNPVVIGARPEGLEPSRVWRVGGEDTDFKLFPPERRRG